MSWVNTSDDVLILLEQTAEAVSSRTGIVAGRGGGGASLDQLRISAVITDDSNPLGLWQSIVVGSLLLTLILCCVIGNFFVIMAILLERDLRSRPQYYLIFSLACADLLVGLVVTPLGAWSTIRQAWNLGVHLCDFWISMDVLVCTSSILHLVAIALDRYWAITNVSYTANRTPRRIFLMLMIIWVLSLLISLAPIFGWKDAQFVTRVREQHVCLISQQISYQVFSTATAFYIPLCAIIVVYYKIMRAAKQRFKRERDRRTVNRNFDDKTRITKIMQHSDEQMRIITPVSKDSICNNNNKCGTPENGHFKFKIKSSESNTNSDELNEDERTPMNMENGGLDTPNNETAFNSQFENDEKPAKRTSSMRIPKRKKRIKESIEAKRERRAWRTLAIITGTFVACWTPFFLLSLYRPICGCQIPPVLESITSWLGYMNSTLNPIIYTAFSPDFRHAFKRIIKRLFFMSDF
ncbi:G-PROTEIN-RECEP-F1-2 domain-containing protein [Aphelenchoides bicaudatus]|nr:G-PROTEIN-RECEP-F1-2 domain-containing protein [Aphelenchoides bicaudatus]